MKNIFEKFNPIIFLMILGAGGIAIIPFAFFQYVIEHGPGLVQISQLGHGDLTIGKEILYRILEGIMILFSLIHLVLVGVYSGKLMKWIKTKDYDEMLHNPLKNASLLAPFIAYTMTLNVFIGPIRFFIPAIANNLQSLMLPALIVWGLIWFFLMKFDIRLLRIAFEKNFDVSKISFGWLLHPFALAMVTVTGTGIAALSKTGTIAHIAAFMSLVSGMMGMFLLLVKLVAIFKSHFAADGLPEKQFLPSFLIVIPNITLFAISAFRLGHYMENHLAAHMGPYFMIVIATAFAFETWYLLFGLALLKRYLKNDFFKNEFYLTQWGFVCPVVAYAVLGSFLYKVVVPNVILYGVILATLAIAVALFFALFDRQLRCAGLKRNKNLDCIE